MQEIRLVDVGEVSALRSHALYHAVRIARGDEGPDAVVLSVPTSQYVSLGLYQQVSRYVDIEFCRNRDIALYRRQIGGGAYLRGPDHLLFHTIFHKERPAKSATRIYQEILRVAVETYRAFGVDAHYLPLTDICVREYRISAGSLGNLDHSVVLASAICHAADPDLERQALRGLSRNSTSMEQELGTAPDRAVVKAKLLENVERTFGARLVPASLTDEEARDLGRLEATFRSPDWTEHADRRVASVAAGAGRDGVRVAEAVHRTEDGITICATVALRGGKIEDVALTGDFFFYKDHLPELERSFCGVKAGWDALMTVAENFYLIHEVDSPGTAPADWVNAIFRASEEVGGKA